MKLFEWNALKNLSNEEIDVRLLDFKKDLLTMKIAKSMGTPKDGNTSKILFLRRAIALMLTLLVQRKGEK